MEKKGLWSAIFSLFPLVLVLTLVGFFCQNPAAIQAAENPPLSDQKTIYDQEKQRAIKAQLDRIGTLLEKERFSSQGTEGESFIQELTQNPPGKSRSKPRAPRKSKPFRLRFPHPKKKKRLHKRKNGNSSLMAKKKKRSCPKAKRFTKWPFPTAA